MPTGVRLASSAESARFEGAAPLNAPKNLTFSPPVPLLTFCQVDVDRRRSARGAGGME